MLEIVNQKVSETSTEMKKCCQKMLREVDKLAALLKDQMMVLER